MNNEIDLSSQIWMDAAEENLEATEVILEMMLASEEEDESVDLD